MADWQPGKLLYKNESILAASEQYLLTTAPTVGVQLDDPITKQIYKQFPYSDIRYERLGPEFITVNEIYNPFKQNLVTKLGHIRISGDGSQEKRFVITMFTQKMYGRPFMKDDSYHNRMKWFINSMFKVYKIKDIQSLALAEKIGCDTGSNWNMYNKVIERFAAKFPKIKTVMYLNRVV